MQKRWILQNPHPDLSQAIANYHQIPLVIAHLLINRGLTEPEQIQHFLQPSLAHLPDPFLLKDMDLAVKRLIRALREKEKITIYGDYDVDGTTSTALLMSFFGALGAKVDFYIPHRLKEGYSLNSEALRKLKARGTQVLITVDNGISAISEAKLAKELGIDLIVTDHHEVPPQLPEATAILNPKQAGDLFPGKELAGVGVAFYLTIALRKALREEGMLGEAEPNLRQSLDLVAVGTIADMAPLIGLNRILVREGLKVLSRSPRLGLKALMEVCAVDREVNSEHVAFRLGPRINAVGRLDDAALGVKLLLSSQPDEAQQLAKILNGANEERQEIEDQIGMEAVAKVESEGLAKRFRSLVLYHPSWHPGVVGIVASRLVEKYHLPSIVLSQDLLGLKGSARSIRNFHLVEALRECSEYLNKFGGHRYAAGLSLDLKNLPAFTERFDQIVRQKLSPEDFIPALKLDAALDLESIDGALLEQFTRLEPFGLGNPAPLLLLRGVGVRESRVVGEKHLKLKVGDSRRSFGAIGFRLAYKIPASQDRIDLAFVPQWNEWNGNKNIQLRISDLRPAQTNAMRKLEVDRVDAPC